MFAKWLKEKRLDLGLTQQELAQEMRVSNVLIALLETGKRVPGIKALNKIARYFKVDVVFLREMIKEDTNNV